MQERDTGAIEVPTFLDEGQRQWEVREIRQPLLPNRIGVLAPPDFSAGWLLFSSGAERRRFAPLPAGWRDAPEAQLRQWCADAAPARNIS